LSVDDGGSKGMTDYRCSHCGIKVMLPPGVIDGPGTCRYCGGAVLPVLAPRAQQFYAARPVAHGYGWLLWVFLGAAAIAAAVVGFRLLRAPTEPKVLMGSRRWVPLGKLAAPISTQVVAAQRGRQVYLSMRLADAQGKAIREVRLSNGRRPDPPEVSILDSDGGVVYRCKLRYG